MVCVCASCTNHVITCRDLTRLTHPTATHSLCALCVYPHHHPQNHTSSHSHQPNPHPQNAPCGWKVSRERLFYDCSRSLDEQTNLASSHDAPHTHTQTAFCRRRMKEMRTDSARTHSNFALRACRQPGELEATWLLRDMVHQLERPAKHKGLSLCVRILLYGMLTIFTRALTQ